jgi:hypothetical protein
VASVAEGTLDVLITNGVLVVTVTAVLAHGPPAVALLAVTVTDFTLPLVGAMNKPVEEMVPALADHATAVLLVLPTVAVN